MKLLGKYWKLILALLLLCGAAFLYVDKYQAEKVAYEAKVAQLKTFIQVLENQIAENKRYEDIQDELAQAKSEIQESRLKLYQHFPKEMRQEDQIMYVLYLESIFGTEINFAFNEGQTMTVLRDGANLNGLILTVNYETTYEGFKNMVSYLATDSRIASVYESTIAYDAKKDIAAGYVTLVLYMVDSDLLEYLPPDIAVPEIGKDNIFE